MGKIASLTLNLTSKLICDLLQGENAFWFRGTVWFSFWFVFMGDSGAHHSSQLLSSYLLRIIPLPIAIIGTYKYRIAFWTYVPLVEPLSPISMNLTQFMHLVLPQFKHWDNLFGELQQINFFPVTERCKGDFCHVAATSAHKAMFLIWRIPYLSL